MKRAVIIGSGMAGLSSAVLLAQRGYRVTVLEQHHRPGGLLQRFYRQGTAYDTGFHYCGGIGEDDILGRCLRHLGVLDRLKWLPMDPEGFDRLLFPGFEFDVPVGFDRYRERLQCAFPHERRGIEGYLDEMCSAVEQYGIYRLKETIDIGAFLAVEEISLAQVMDRHVQDPRLRAILAGEISLYMVPPREAPFGLHAVILHHFLSGAWRIKGGGDAMASVLVDRIRELGGEMRTRARAVRVHVDDRVVRAVETEDGERFDADVVFSDIHPRLLLPMLPPNATRAVYRQRVQSARVGFPHVGLYVELDVPPRCIGNANVYRMDSLSHEDAFIPPGPDRVPFYFVTAPGEALPEGENHPHTLLVLAAHRWEQVAHWADSQPGRRPAEYESFKEGIQDVLLNALFTDFPEIRGHVTRVESSTGITTQRYTLSPEGAAYGHYPSVHQMGRHRPAQAIRVRNLVQVGQGVFAPGILGTTLSAYYGLATLVGLGPVVKALKDIG